MNGPWKLVIAALSIVVMSCSRDTGLAPFASDGCSLFPDRDLISQADWCACCVEHDVAYWKGGTTEQREAADRRLADCVRTATGDEALARVMYEGVRAGGSPYFYNWYRWGYGWSDGRLYQALTREEEAIASRLLALGAEDDGALSRVCTL